MKKKFQSLIPYIIFVLFSIAIFKPYFFNDKVPFAGNLLVAYFQPWKSYRWDNYSINGPANKPIGFDTLRIFYPFRILTTESLKQGKIPLWNPYTFSGNMYLAAYQTAVFFPLTPLFLILPAIDAWSLMVILAPFLTAVFMYMFLQSLRLSRKASIIGAMTFGFSGIVVAFTEEWYIASYSIVCLPLIFYSVKKMSENISVKNFTFLIVGLCASILSGWFQMTFYTFIFGFFWVMFLFWQNKRKRNIFLVSVFIATIISLFISSIYLIPNIQAYFYSTRGTSDAKYIFDLYLLPVYKLITYLAPDFWGNPATYTYFGGGFYQEKILYVGIVGLFFALYALLRKNALSSVSMFFSISWIVSLSLGLSLPTSWLFLYYLHIPLLSTLVPSRIIIIAAFCLGVISSFGIDAFLQENGKKRLSIITSFLVLVLIAGWGFALYYKWKNPLSFFAMFSLKSMILPTIFLVALCLLLFIYRIYKKKMLKVFFPLLFVVTLIPLYYFAHKYLYFSERNFTFPKVPVLTKLQEIQGSDRSWSFGPGYVSTNLTAYYHLYSVEGYDSFYLQRYGELLDASANKGERAKYAPRVDADMVSAQSIQEILNNPYRIKLLNLLGVKYIFGKSSTKDTKFLSQNPSSPLVQIWSDGKYTIYQNKNAYPRAFLLDSYAVESKKDNSIRKIYSHDFDLSKTVLLEQTVSLTHTQTPLLGNAKIITYKPEYIKINEKTNKKAFLFLSDNYYPGWKAYVDGKETKIYQADYTFRAIIVPKGAHTIVFSYTPFIFTIGVIITISGFLLLLVTGFTIYMVQKREL